MGWDYQHRDKGTSNVDFFREGWSEGYELIDGATVAGTFYGALRRPDGLVECIITLTRWVPNDWYNFGKKDMGEGWGTGQYQCPERILDLLSPTEDLYGPSLTQQVCDNHYDCSIAKPENEGKVRGWNLPHINQREEPTGARAWADIFRADCRAYHAKRKQVKVGSIIRLPTASTGEFFQLADKRRNLFYRVYQNAATGAFEPLRHTRHRIPWWRNGGYEVVA